MLPQIVTLNVPDQTFSYYAEGNQIIGWWDITKVTSLYPTQVTHADETFDPPSPSTRSTGLSATATSASPPNGRQVSPTTASSSAASWNGAPASASRRVQPSSSAASTAPQPGGDETEVGFQPLVYSFETSRIKDHLFAWLQFHGWNHRGAIGRTLAHRLP